MTFFEEFKNKLNELYDVDNLTSLVKNPSAKLLKFDYDPKFNDLMALVAPLNYRKIKQIHSVFSLTDFALFSEFRTFSLDFNVYISSSTIAIRFSSFIIKIKNWMNKNDVLISCISEDYNVSDLIDESIYENIYQDALNSLKYRYPNVSTFSEFHRINSLSVDDIKRNSIKNKDVVYLDAFEWNEKNNFYLGEDLDLKKIFSFSENNFNSVLLGLTNVSTVRKINTLYSLLIFEAYLDNNDLKDDKRIVYIETPFKFYDNYYFYAIPMPTNKLLKVCHCLALGTHDEVLSYHMLRENASCYWDNEFENSVFGYDNIYNHIRNRIIEKVISALNINQNEINLNSLELYSIINF